MIKPFSIQLFYLTNPWNNCVKHSLDPAVNLPKNGWINRLMQPPTIE